MTRRDVKGDQPSGGETTWTNTGATRYGRGQHKTGSFGDNMLRPSPNHGTQQLPNDDEMMGYEGPLGSGQDGPGPSCPNPLYCIVIVGDKVVSWYFQVLI